MSFLRPEVISLLHKWAETATLSALTLAGMAWLLFATHLSTAWTLGLTGFVAAVGLVLIRAAALSALSSGGGEAPGIVSVDERRISFFGPHQGGVVTLGDIHEIEIWAEDPTTWHFETEWVLRWSETEPALIIPVSAKGAEMLADAFAALPGFSTPRAIAALRARGGKTISIWKRDGAEGHATLAPAQTPD